MTPNELYQRTPEKIEPLIDEDGWLAFVTGCYYKHLPEIEPHDGYKFAQTDRIVCKVYKDFCFDGRRIWRLASIWMDNEPVMIIQNAGREGDDYVNRFITNHPKYKEMIQLLVSLSIVKAEKQDDVVDPNEDINSLTCFYNNCLDDHFERY